jgi:hypothetical protein
MMKTFVNGLKAQYKLFIKDKINWLFAVAFLLIFLLDNSFSQIKTASPVTVAKQAALFLVLSSPIFYVVFFIRYFLKETGKKYAYLWSRDDFGNTFLLTKLAVGIIGFITLSSPTLLVLISGIAYYHGAAQILPSLGIVLLILLSSYLFVITLSSLMAILIRNPLPAMAVLILVVGYLTTRRPLYLDHLSAMPGFVYSSQIIGIGPHRLPFLANRAFILGVTIIFLLLGMLFARVRLPRNPNRLKPIATILFGLGFAAIVGFTIYMGIKLNEIGKLVTVTPNFEAREQQALICKALDSYQVVLQVNNKNSFVHGQVTIHAPAGLDLSQSMSLNAGLINDRLLLREKEAGIYTIDYNGTFVVPVYSYAGIAYPREIEELGFATGAMFDKEMVMLLRNGEWHPLSNCNPDKIEVQITELKEIYYSSTAQITEENEAVNFKWEGLMPDVLFLSGGDYQEEKIEHSYALIPKHSSPGLLENTEIYSKMVARLQNALTGKPADKQKVYVTPLLSHAIQNDSTHLFIPESGPAANREDKEAAILRDVVQSWWCEGYACPGFARGSIHNGTYMEISKDDAVYEQTALVPLLYYASLKIANEGNTNEIQFVQIVEEYRNIQDSDPGTAAYQMLFLPFQMEAQGRDIFVGLADLDSCGEEEYFWDLLKMAKERYAPGYFTKDELNALVLEVSGKNLDQFGGECEN